MAVPTSEFQTYPLAELRTKLVTPANVRVDRKPPRRACEPFRGLFLGPCISTDSLPMDCVSEKKDEKRGVLACSMTVNQASKRKEWRMTGRKRGETERNPEETRSDKYSCIRRRTARPHPTGICFAPTAVVTPVLARVHASPTKRLRHYYQTG